MSVKLYDIYGKQTSNHFNSGFIDTSDLPDGIYILNISDNKDIFINKKVVVLH